MLEFYTEMLFMKLLYDYKFNKYMMSIYDQNLFNNLIIIYLKLFIRKIKLIFFFY